MKRISSIHASRGLSLVELLVALVLGLIISGAAMQLFLVSKSTYRLQESLARVQENGRFGIGYLANDIRMAGYTGCGNLDRIPVKVMAIPPTGTSLDDYQLTSGNMVFGTDGVGASNQWSAVAGTDVLEIRRGGNSNVRLTGNTAPNNANTQVTVNEFKIDDILLITDCMAAHVFRVSSISNTTKTITHGNGENDLNKLDRAYGTDAEVMSFDWITYSVRNTGRTTRSGTPIRALFVAVRGGGSGGTVQNFELIEGVENIQFEYGVDTTSDRNADVYRTANNINAAGWEDVVSVRMSLLISSSEEGVTPLNGDAAAQRITYNGAAVAADGRLRQVFGSVVGIRNRLP